MMSKISRFVFVLSVFAVFVSALSQGQDSEKVQVFGGYSLLSIDNGGLNGPTLDALFGTPTPTFSAGSNFSGWNAEIQYNVRRSLGVVADFSGNYGSIFNAPSGSGISGLPSNTSYSFLFGPVLEAKRGRLSPYVHVLFGANRLSSSATNSLTGVAPAALGSATDTSFALALGGGIDYKLTSKFGLRLAQLDYLYTNHDLNAFNNKIFGAGSVAGLATTENNLRFSAGITYRF